ncbi:hypothetical protein BD310DRAFT_936935 [Dichomitus squalens]|uniref:Uncharacterized protein n=1 Tax=Dichomitus squalens TaxID=114155 RepID=A0A4Q9PIV1_9APHY|nr:hypothetical protein BD310DRAFT_936935 [Dichomitus squalens]
MLDADGWVASRSWTAAPILLSAIRVAFLVLRTDAFRQSAMCTGSHSKIRNVLPAQNCSYSFLEVCNWGETRRY